MTLSKVSCVRWCPSSRSPLTSLSHMSRGRALDGPSYRGCDAKYREQKVSAGRKEKGERCILLRSRARIMVVVVTSGWTAWLVGYVSGSMRPAAATPRPSGPTCSLIVFNLLSRDHVAELQYNATKQHYDDLSFNISVPDPSSHQILHWNVLTYKTRQN